MGYCISERNDETGGMDEAGIEHPELMEEKQMRVVKKGQTQEFPEWSEISQHGIASFPAGGECKPHRHNTNEFYVVVSGAIEAFVEDGRYALEPGDLLPIKAGSKHGLKAKEDATIVYFFGNPVISGESEVAKHVDATGKPIQV